jgi:uncharacterized protein YbjT (DUF2867 family)
MGRQSIFVTGGSGYIGSRLIPLLARRNHSIRALVRKGSERKLPADCMPVEGNALDRSTFVHHIDPAGTFIQLVGVSHPSPSKGEQFRAIDLVSARESVAAAVEAGVTHFIYLSVAHPAPMMKDYIAVRSEGEFLLKASKLKGTILRPWYVLGPGHRWPYLLAPFYWIFERLPPTRASAQRLGLVSVQQMLKALIHAVENPPSGIRIIEVPEIRALSRSIT